jgi:hypothetical protein
MWDCWVVAEMSGLRVGTRGFGFGTFGLFLAFFLAFGTFKIQRRHILGGF